MYCLTLKLVHACEIFTCFCSLFIMIIPTPRWNELRGYGFFGFECGQDVMAKLVTFCYFSRN